MKQLQALILSVLFLVPSIGVHVDLTHCCGGLENIGIAHQAAVSISKCCDTDKSKNCEDVVELIVPQQLLDYSIANSVEYPVPSVSLVPYSIGIHHYIFGFSPQYNKEVKANKEHPSQALFQVFLC